MAAVQRGDALILLPHDDVMESISLRLQAAMKAAGLSLADLQAAVLEERAKLVQERYGHLIRKRKRKSAR